MKIEGYSAKVKLVMRIIVFCFLLSATSFLFYPNKVLAGDIRGKVESQSSYSKTVQPVRSIKIELLKCWTNFPCRLKDYTYTSSSGFYYFRNISPGAYKLRINETDDVSIRVYNQDFQNIPPILIR